MVMSWTAVGLWYKNSLASAKGGSFLGLAVSIAQEGGKDEYSMPYTRIVGHCGRFWQGAAPLGRS